MNKDNYKLIYELMQVLIKQDDQSQVKLLMEKLLNILMDLEREEHIGASRYERTLDRDGFRNGYKSRAIKTTRFGSLEINHPQVRDSSKPFHSRLFEHYQRSEKALLIASAEMYYKGVSTRKICKLYRDVFETDISPQFVSNAARELDEHINTWKNEPITDEIPILVIDALYKKCRDNSRVVSKGVINVCGIDINGQRRFLCSEVADCESFESYRDIFSKLRSRGLRGVQYIISDSHDGLKAAISRYFDGSTWQRCRVHFMRNYIKRISNLKDRKKFLSLIKNVYNQISRESSLLFAEQAADFLCKTGHIKLSKRFLEEIEETLQYFWFCEDSSKLTTKPFVQLSPSIALRKLSTSNFIERINGEMKRRLHSIRIFPNADSLLRLVSSMAIELDEEWRYGRKFINFNDIEIAA